jgi:hypothetical protein
VNFEKELLKIYCVLKLSMTSCHVENNLPDRNNDNYMTLRATGYEFSNARYGYADAVGFVLLLRFLRRSLLLLCLLVN